MAVSEVLPFKVALWLSNVSKIELCICLMPVFRMCWCLFYRIKSYQLSCADHCWKEQVAFNKAASRCNYSHVPVEMSCCRVVGTRIPLYFSIQAEISIHMLWVLIVKKPMKLLHMLSKTKAFYVASCFVLSVVYSRMLAIWFLKRKCLSCIFGMHLLHEFSWSWRFLAARWPCYAL